MSEYSITVEGGTSKRLLTAGKYCDRDIVVTATGGGGGGDVDALIDGSFTEFTSDVTNVRANALRTSNNLVTVNFPKATIAGAACLYQCGKLKSVNMPKLQEVPTEAFGSCKVLANVHIPEATSILSSAFSADFALAKIDLPKVTTIDSNVFQNCSKLKILILRHSGGIVTLKNKNALYATLIYRKTTGYIYVPAALVEDYKVDTNWSTFATQFRALEDYTVDGTITGEFDESKI